MQPDPSSEVTELLDAWSGGDRQALDRLVPLVIEDLRALARAYLARENAGHTLQPTALVNEAFLRLLGRRQVQLESRVQFFAVLAQTMRRILVDHARRKKAARHGGGTPPLPIEEALDLPIRYDVDLVALDEALTELAGFAPRQAETIQLSYFGGLTFDEIALALEVSPATVQRDLRAAKIWLLKELQRRGAGA
ncbi:MAG TPA: sigma-70 family RNA polymerase sigma factor [Thermoanaerobaculia bacterium]|nr:sigma-70 family RNA polymerase sigma factor [Thermoanaerobaculia bacterium]